MTPQAPLRPCPRCGRTHRAWTHDRICTRCSGELRRLEQGGPSLRELREQNQARIRAGREQKISGVQTSLSGEEIGSSSGRPPVVHDGMPRALSEDSSPPPLFEARRQQTVDQLEGRTR